MTRYRGHLQSYFSQADRLVTGIIEKESPEYLLAVDPDEYLDHLVAELSFQTLAVRWQDETVEPFKTRQERMRSWDSWDRDRPQIVDVEMYRVRIPVEPNPDRDQYFALEASKGYLGYTEPEWRFDGDVLVKEVPATEEAVKKLRDDFRYYTDARNEDIAQGNPKLRDIVGPVWRARRKALEENAAKSKTTIEKLGLRLYEKPDAPKPVAIEPRKLVLPAPKAKPHEPEGSLGTGDVEKLVTAVGAHGRQLETAPATYAKLQEEALRDIILGLLNASFAVTAPEAAGTAETFSKLGKTDIQLKVAGFVPLVIECKFWSGPKDYLAGLAQLFDYVTWRQGHAVLVHFSKNQDLTATVRDATVAVAADATTIGNAVRRSESSFVSRHQHPQDAGKTIDVHHLFFDLSVSPTRTRGRGSGDGA
jgi:hypothetical protein